MYTVCLGGTVLAPFLFALYTADCRSTDKSCPLVKFADDVGPNQSGNFTGRGSEGVKIKTGT